MGYKNMGVSEHGVHVDQFRGVKPLSKDSPSRVRDCKQNGYITLW